MGHDIETHREYYRLPQETILLAKMSKLFNLASEGKLHKFKGKSLEDVAVSPEEVLSTEVAEEEGGRRRTRRRKMVKGKVQEEKKEGQGQVSHKEITTDGQYNKMTFC
ncbi:hypothetical protein HOLleu_01097 [Holothuria leucospilota]|uniref:Uncharacterized protein n=1 Tax=Holothuria leucospilota TaxID=206669 RepID=A0A9Q1HG78_HOLLE|nr:hypothetical protein HOLleu_01097 [Holothuria leucospilota]